MDKKMYLSIMAALATTLAIWAIAQLVAPFVKPLAWALIIGVATTPHYERLAERFPGKPNRSAGIMVLIITLYIIFPIAWFIVMIAQNATTWYGETQQLVQAFTKALPNTLPHIPLGNEIVRIADRLGLDFAGSVAKITSESSRFLFNAVASAAKNLASLLFTLVLALFILFFIYRDGNRIVYTAADRFFTRKVKVVHYLHVIRATTTAVLVGTILTALAQGTLAGIGYALAGVPAPVLCGALTALTALIPVIGTALVWVPLVGLVAITDTYLKAGLLALWCLVFVGLADNAIRPLAIGAKSNIPIPAIVLGAMGGVFALGMMGLIVGPLVFAILAVIWREATGQAAPVELEMTGQEKAEQAKGEEG